MRVFMAIACTTIAIGWIPTALGGESCCAAAEKTETANEALETKAPACGTSCLSDLSLNEEQYKQAALVLAECLESGCTPESAANMHEALKSLLTEEQFAQLKARCAESGCVIGAEKTQETDT